MRTEQDRRNTKNAIALDKESYKYKRFIGYRLGKRFGSLVVRKFHDVHNSMYRFDCFCELCGQEGIYTYTFLKSLGKKCRHCKGVPQQQKLIVEPPQKPQFQFCEVEASISSIGSLCFDYLKSEMAMGTNDGKDDKYHEAKMTVALHDLAKVKGRLLNIYETLMGQK